MLLHINGVVVLNQKSLLFEKLEYDNRIPYKEQLICSILKCLPFNVAISGKAPYEEINIKFYHDSVKNYFLIK